MKTAKPIQFVHVLSADALGGKGLPDSLELARAGSWHTPWHGDFDLGASDLEEAVRNFDAGIYRVRGTEPLPAGLDHQGGPAAYRIEKLWIQPADDDPNTQSLWAGIIWTQMGKEKIERDEYRYTSMEYHHRGIPLENPEKAGEFFVNVLTGATLTNDPLFKKLKPVMASARTGSDNNNEGDSMDLQTLRAKDASALKPEEKAFLADHKTELTDEERTKFELVDEGGSDDSKDADDTKKTDTKSADDKGDKGNGTDDSGTNTADQPPTLEASATGAVTLTATQYATLKAGAEAGQRAEMALDKEKTTQAMKAHATTGRIKPDQVEEVVGILMASTPTLRGRLEKLLASLPENRLITSGETGATGDDAGANNGERLNAAAMELAAKENIDFREAVTRVKKDRPELANYHKEDE